MYNLFSKLEASTDPEKLLYEWVKTGVITLTEFKKVIKDRENEANTRGFREGRYKEQGGMN